MKQLFKKEDLINKTIVKTANLDSIFIQFFSDDTYIVFESHSDIEILSIEFSLLPENTGDAFEFREMGIITEEEYKVFMTDVDNKKRVKKDKEDRELYQKLKDKFEK